MPLFLPSLLTLAYVCQLAYTWPLVISTTADDATVGDAGTTKEPKLGADIVVEMARVEFRK